MRYFQFQIVLAKGLSFIIGQLNCSENVRFCFKKNKRYSNYLLTPFNDIDINILIDCRLTKQRRRTDYTTLLGDLFISIYLSFYTIRKSERIHFSLDGYKINNTYC